MVMNGGGGGMVHDIKVVVIMKVVMVLVVMIKVVIIKVVMMVVTQLEGGTKVVIYSGRYNGGYSVGDIVMDIAWI